MSLLWSLLVVLNVTMSWSNVLLQIKGDFLELQITQVEFEPNLRVSEINWYD